MSHYLGQPVVCQNILLPFCCKYRMPKVIGTCATRCCATWDRKCLPKCWVVGLRHYLKKCGRLSGGCIMGVFWLMTLIGILVGNLVGAFMGLMVACYLGWGACRDILGGVAGAGLPSEMVQW